MRLMKNNTMKNRILTTLFALMLCGSAAFATSTTYTFTNKSWKSQVGSVVCDGTTDGWKSDKDGSDYWPGNTQYTDGLLRDKGVKVNKNETGAGATSVLEFENIRKVIVNFCVTSSGKGDITVVVGDTTMSKHVEKSMKRSDVTDGYKVNEDIEFELKTQRTGKVKLSVENVTTSGVLINSITIKADNGSGETFSTKVFHLVTDVNQLQDNDLIMIGIADGKTNKVLGYFDTDISKNNIHAVSAKYDANREYVNANEEVTYVLNKAVSEKGQQACFTIIDPYAEAYLVASGGKTKNALRIWDKAYDANTYGDYGYWDIQIATDGKATIMCLGNSLGKYIQYNPTFDLFGCYQQETMTAVNIYRQEEAKDLTQPMIVAPMVNFGTAVLRGDVTSLSGEKTIEIKANKLTEDINAWLENEDAFSLNKSKIDRDGDMLTVSYYVTQPGKYTDTLVLQSSGVESRTAIHLTVAKELSIAEAVESKDFEYIYLNPVTVTKKYDRHVYVRDESGAMMLYDEGPDNGRYAKDMVNGNVLKNVEGKFQNYWGVPELHLMAQPSFNKNQTVECLPELMTECADSADVCRYVVYENVPAVYGELELSDGSTSEWPAIKCADGTLLLSEFFTLGDQSESMYALEQRIKAGETHLYDIEGIVSYDYDDVVLYPTLITHRGKTNPDGLEEVGSCEAGTQKVLRNGVLYILREGKTYDSLGNEIK